MTVPSDVIAVRGARQHNLKNINIDIPKNKLVIITGLSGSGKSTLAFDTLYAEGQRRYVESLSAYARQFLERMEKPDVDGIEGLSPAIAIEQKNTGHNPRSTVGTVTEIYDYLRLLYARVGTIHCHQCGAPISRQTVDQMMDRIMTLPESTRLIIFAPLVAGQKGSHEKLLARLKKDGFARVRIDGKIREMDGITKLAKTPEHDIDVVIDRLVIKPAVQNRLADSLELAMAQGGGTVLVDVLSKTGSDVESTIVLSEHAVCPACHIGFAPLSPASFSFNSPQGACPECKGLGTITKCDPGLIVPNPRLSLREGAVAPWVGRSSVRFFEFMDSLTRHFGTDVFAPYETLPESFKKVLLYGSGNEKITFYFERNNRRSFYDKAFEGVIPNLERRYNETDSRLVREEIERFMTSAPCPVCLGDRLNPVSRNVRVAGKTVREMTCQTIDKAYQTFSTLYLSPKDLAISHRIVNEISQRLAFLNNVGLSYLTLERNANTLSGGESQRIRLATQIGSKLTGVLYVLDEPSIGLHQKDNEKLLASLKQMRDIQNSVLVVEHDEDTIMAADFVIDMGPGAGVNGGQIVFSGTPQEMCQSLASLTGQYLSGKKKIDIPKMRRPVDKGKLGLVQVQQNNLKNIDVDFPIGCFTCVTGVSGSGKSSLVIETLYPALSQEVYGARVVTRASYKELTGHEKVDKVINIDQGAIGKTPRSNPGTYTGLFTHIRELFAKTPDARMRGYKPGRFSFNVKGGPLRGLQRRRYHQN